MSISVSVPALWDGNGTFLNNALVGVQADAIVVGTTQKATSPADPTSVNTLQVKDRRYGTLYLSITLSQWQNAANQTDVTPDTNLSFTATGNTTFMVPVNSWTVSGAALAITNATETINIGTTPGGFDLAHNLAINNTNYVNVNFVHYYPAGKLIYISGATGTVNYRIIIMTQ